MFFRACLDFLCLIEQSNPWTWTWKSKNGIQRIRIQQSPANANSIKAIDWEDSMFFKAWLDYLRSMVATWRSQLWTWSWWLKNRIQRYWLWLDLLRQINPDERWPSSSEETKVQLNHKQNCTQLFYSSQNKLKEYWTMLANLFFLSRWRSFAAVSNGRSCVHLTKSLMTFICSFLSGLISRPAHSNVQSLMTLSTLS